MEIYSSDRQRFLQQLPYRSGMTFKGLGDGVWPLAQQYQEVKSFQITMVGSGLDGIPGVPPFPLSIIPQTGSDWFCNSTHSCPHVPLRAQNKYPTNHRLKPLILEPMSTVPLSKLTISGLCCIDGKLPSTTTGFYSMHGFFGIENLTYMTITNASQICLSSPPQLTIFTLAHFPSLQAQTLQRPLASIESLIIRTSCLHILFCSHIILLYFQSSLSLLPS